MTKIDEEVQIVPPNNEWKCAFQIEASKIKNKLRDKIIAIQHIGSTAIPNIYAKPIIDIMIGKDLSNAKEVIADLVVLG